MKETYFQTSREYWEGKFPCLHTKELCQNMPKKEEKSKYCDDFLIFLHLRIYFVGLYYIFGLCSVIQDLKDVK